jgi:hypothetical protein
MICEECKQREATVFLTQIINREMIKLSLCELCARPIMEQMPQARTPEPEDTSQPDTDLFSLTPDPTRPQTIAIPDPVTVGTLATSLHAHPFEVVRDLMHLNIFATTQTELPFATASGLCSQYGVTAIKVA